jgi:hypothetical protein
MSDINMTIVRHHGEVAALGRNLVLKLMLEKSAAKDRAAVWHVPRNYQTKSFIYPGRN